MPSASPAFAGMLGVTFFGLFLTPLFFVLLRTNVKRRVRSETRKQTAAGRV